LQTIRALASTHYNTHQGPRLMKRRSLVQKKKLINNNNNNNKVINQN